MPSRSYPRPTRLLSTLCVKCLVRSPHVPTKPNHLSILCLLQPVHSSFSLLNPQPVPVQAMPVFVSVNVLHVQGLSETRLSSGHPLPVSSQERPVPMPAKPANVPHSIPVPFPASIPAASYAISEITCSSHALAVASQAFAVSSHASMSGPDGSVTGADPEHPQNTAQTANSSTWVRFALMALSIVNP